MVDPVTTAVAAALATKAVNELTEAGKVAFTGLVRLVRRKLAANMQADALRGAEADPASEARRVVLAEALASAMANDRHFSEQLVRLWRRVDEDRGGGRRSSVVNTVSGDVGGNLVQVRDIRGNVSFG